MKEVEIWWWCNGGEGLREREVKADRGSGKY